MTYNREEYIRNKERYNRTAKEWAKNNKEQHANNVREWRKNNKVRDHENNVSYRAANRERFNELGRTNQFNARLRWRVKLFEILGTQCERCDENDPAVLQYNHINGGGTKELKNKFKGGNMAMYRYYALHPDEARKKLNVLCSNCNWREFIDRSEEASSFYTELRKALG